MDRSKADPLDAAWGARLPNDGAADGVGPAGAVSAGFWKENPANGFLAAGASSAFLASVVDDDGALAVPDPEPNENSGAGVGAEDPNAGAAEADAAGAGAAAVFGALKAKGDDDCALVPKEKLLLDAGAVGAAVSADAPNEKPEKADGGALGAGAGFFVSLKYIDGRMYVLVREQEPLASHRPAQDVWEDPEF